MQNNSPNQFEDLFKDFGRKAIGVGVLVILLNLTLLAGAIAVVVLVLRALNVIG